MIWFYRILAGFIFVGSVPAFGLAGLALAAYTDSVLPLWLGLALGVLGLLLACSLFEHINKKAKPPQRVRWIERGSNIAFGDCYYHHTGVVIREYMDSVQGSFAISEPFIEARLENGTVIRMPKGSFRLCAGDVLEYRV